MATELMAAEMKVTDAVAHDMAGEFLTRLHQAVSVEPNEHAIACMRIVAEKHLAAMLEPVGWQGEDIENNWTRLHETDKDLAKLEGKPWFRAHRVYRIKPE